MNLWGGCMMASMRTLCRPACWILSKSRSRFQPERVPILTRCRRTLRFRLTPIWGQPWVFPKCCFSRTPEKLSYCPLCQRHGRQVRFPVCAHLGGFEIDVAWTAGAVTTALVRSTLGRNCRVRASASLQVTRDGRPVQIRIAETNVIEFPTEAGAAYRLSRLDNALRSGR